MNLDQFDGHTPGPWEVHTLGKDEQYHIVHRPYGHVNLLRLADAQLIAAAPDLLAEVKRLRAALSTCLWYAETDGTSFGTEFPLHDIIEVCDWALNEEDEEA